MRPSPKDRARAGLEWAKKNTAATAATLPPEPYGDRVRRFYHDPVRFLDEELAELRSEMRERGPR